MSNIESGKQAEYLDHVLTIKQFFNRHRHGSYIFAVSYSYALKKEVNREVIEFCNENGLSVGEAQIHFEANTTPIQQLNDAKDKFPDGLILTNIDELMLISHDEFAYQLNQMREALFELHIPILIWLTPENHSAFTHKAIDLYTRRDLDTLFFPEIKQEDTSHLLERSELKLDQIEDPETLRTRIFLLEKQLDTARIDDIPRSRIAKEIALPLITAYKQLLMIQPALALVNEFKNDFTGNERDAFIAFGQLSREAGNLEDAISYFEKALAIDINVTGENSYNTSVDYSELGEVWINKGNLDKAISYFEKALSISLELFGEQNLNTAIYYNNLGSAWQDKGDLDKGISCYERALVIDLKLVGDKNKNISISYNNLGSAWRDKGNLDKAISYFEKALAISLELFGEQSPNTAIYYNNLGNAWLDKGDLVKAFGYLEKALLINTKLFGDESRNTSTFYNSLGSAWNFKGDFDKAINYYQKALDIDLKLFGEGNPLVAIRDTNLGNAWRDKGNFEKAEFYFRKAYDIFSSTYGAEHHYTVDLMNRIKSLENAKPTAYRQVTSPAEASTTV